MEENFSFEDFGMTKEEFEKEALEALKELQANGQFLNLDFNFFKEHF